MNGNYYPEKGADNGKYIFMFVIVEIRDYTTTYYYLLLLCEEYFCFHKIFQETQEHLCTAVVVLFTSYILQAYR